MAKNKIFYQYILSLSLAVIFLPGCVYLTHLDEVTFLKSLDTSQKEMQPELDKEEKLYNKLKSDIDNGRLHKLTPKRKIFRLYGEPTLCKPAEAQGQIKETCIYRKPGGLFTQIILLDLDAQERLSSWRIQGPEK
jgi:hypothetical protein